MTVLSGHGINCLTLNMIKLGSKEQKCKNKLWILSSMYLDPTLVGEENETFLMRVWKPLHSLADAF